MKRRKRKPSVRATKIERHGLSFPSTFQANCYTTLLERQEKREIFDLAHEVVFPLTGQGVTIYGLTRNKDKARVYTADATYRETDNPEVLVVHESKGKMMGEASLRLSIFKALYPEHHLEIVKQHTRKKRKPKSKIRKKISTNIE